MKKIVAILIALMLCAALAVPALANEFTPSVSNKLAPEIVPVVDPEGVPAAGIIYNEIDDPISYVYGECIVITPVSKAEESEKIPEDARVLLLQVYKELTTGEMQIPYGDIYDDVDPDNMVIRDLFDVSFLCEEHPAMLAPKGVTFTITFDLGVDADEDVRVMTYKNGAWGSIVSVINNGDGTLTCEFEDFCPVAFAVEVDDEQPGEDPEEPSEPEDPSEKPEDPSEKPEDPSEKPEDPSEKPEDPSEEPGETTQPGKPNDPTGPVEPPKTGDEAGEQLMLWAGLAVLCLIAVVVLTVIYSRNMKKED